jgi:hypothetical protein
MAVKTPSGNTEEDGNAVSMPDRTGFGPVLKPILVSARAEETQRRSDADARLVGLWSKGAKGARAEAMPTPALDRF